MSDIRDRIRKLLALAADGSAGEAGTAADMAARLMTEHGISEAEAVASGRPRATVGHRVVELRSAASTESVGYHGVMDALGGTTVQASRGGGTVVHCYLSEDLIDSALDLVRFIRAQVVRECMRESHSANTTRVRAWRNAFMINGVSRACARLKALRGADVERARVVNASTGHALMVQSQDVIARRAQDFPRVQSRRTSTSSNDGSRAGRAAGDRVDLGQQRMTGQRALPGR